MSLDADAIANHLTEFAQRRDWEQYHTPKNLAMAIAGEAGELAAEFQWLTAEESWEVMERSGDAVRDELADVLQYLIRLADLLEVDLEAAVWNKLNRNEERFPTRPSAPTDRQGSSDSRSEPTP